LTKVTPVWDGGGTVKLTILDANFNKATNTLIETVQNEIDPVGHAGKGFGIAPIGHVVTVDTVDEVTINIATNILFDDGYSWEGAEQEIIDLMEEYLLDLRKEWASQNQLIVRVAQIETRILTVPGVIDITNTKINGLPQNLFLGEYEIPILGVVSG